LHAAIGVFAQQGFGAATTDDIARAAGRSKGGLYWHFKSKDEILEAILAQFFDHEMAGLARLVAAGGSASARLRQLAAETAGSMAELKPVLPIALEFCALAARQERVRQWIERYYARYHSLLADLLRQGYAGGEFHSSTAESAGLALLAQMEGLVLIWSVAPQAVRLPEQLTSAIDLFVQGLAATGGRLAAG
jgi:AcrR family transcriptional regulator